MDDLTGQRLNDYQLLRQLGRGAMAAVYLADQKSLSRRVAVKVLAAELCRDQAYVDRFQHEARSAASLVHPGIVQVYEVGVAKIDGAERHYLAQEYVPDGTLGRHAEKAGVLPPGRVLDVLWQVGAALSAAAERGLVHRDIKPDNLMVDRSGAVKVADFGLARLVEAGAPRMTQAGVAMGTPLYMSPEQIEGREVDARSDLYSLGVTAYQLLSGEPPFTGETPLSVAVQHLNNAPQPVAERQPSTPAALAAVVDRLIAKSPEERFASPLALLEELGAVAREAEGEGWSHDGSTARIGASTVAGTWTPRTTDETAAVNRLSAAMRAAPPRSRRWRRLAAFGAVGVVVGALVAAAIGPRPLLATGEARVERFDTVKHQLFHAKTLDTPDAWRAVLEYHPEADPYDAGLALRGFALNAIRRGEERRAASALDRLPEPPAGESGDPVVAAARVIAYAQTGQASKARTAGAALSATSSQRLAPLKRSLPDLFERADRELADLD